MSSPAIGGPRAPSWHRRAAGSMGLRRGRGVETEGDLVHADRLERVEDGPAALLPVADVLGVLRVPGLPPLGDDDVRDRARRDDVGEDRELLLPEREDRVIAADRGRRRLEEIRALA